MPPRKPQRSTRSRKLAALPKPVKPGKAARVGRTDRVGNTDSVGKTAPAREPAAVALTKSTWSAKPSKQRKPGRNVSHAPNPRSAQSGRAAHSGASDRSRQTDHSGAPNPEPGGLRQSVRIIAGAWRGRRVGFPDLPGLRPTPDRVRETLFNWLQHEVPGARCLDLFAGSGALGLEALSRGASQVVFVEQAQAAARSLVRELERLGGSTRATVREMGATRFLRERTDMRGYGYGYGHGDSGVSHAEVGAGRAAAAAAHGAVGAKGAAVVTSRREAASPHGAGFDIAFLDPPFGQNALADFIPLLDAGDWVRTGGWVYLENERSSGAPVLPVHWELCKSKSAGEVGYHLARIHERVGQDRTGS